MEDIISISVLIVILLFGTPLEYMKERIENLQKVILDSYKKTKRSGSHVISTKGLGPSIPQAGIPMPRHPNCEFITDGMNIVVIEF